MTPTAGTRETQVEIDPQQPIIRITRDFDAPVSKVFRAHTDPDLLAQWLGPRGLTMRVESWDCRTGGSYRYVHVDPDGNEYGFRGCFHELRQDESIVQTFSFDGEPDGVALERLRLEDLGHGRTRLTATSVGESLEARDRMVASGMEHGIRESYERLDELLG